MSTFRKSQQETKTTTGRGINLNRLRSGLNLFFPVRLRNRLISAGLEPVVSHTENHVLYCIVDKFLRIVR